MAICGWCGIVPSPPGCAPPAGAGCVAARRNRGGDRREHGGTTTITGAHSYRLPPAALNGNSEYDGGEEGFWSALLAAASGSSSSSGTGGGRCKTVTPHPSRLKVTGAEVASAVSAAQRSSGATVTADCLACVSQPATHHGGAPR